jgi:hypothetical protein
MEFYIDWCYKCFKCSSSKVGQRYSPTADSLIKYDNLKQREVTVDDPSYLIHYDFLMCFDCRAMDVNYDYLWKSYTMTFKEPFCSCGGKEMKVLELTEVSCLNCNKEIKLEVKETNGRYRGQKKEG